jgi:hypothetical protein
MGVKHKFTSGVADGGDATLIRPSNWNDDHQLVSSSTDNAVVRFDGTAGDAVQDSGVTIDDSNNVTVPATVNMKSYKEDVFTISDGGSVELNPNNGSIQLWTLGATRTPTAASGWQAGQSMTLMVDDGTDYAITWTSITPVWLTGGGNAPSLKTTGFTAIQLWKVSTTIYGARVGDS